MKPFAIDCGILCTASNCVRYPPCSGLVSLAIRLADPKKEQQSTIGRDGVGRTCVPAEAALGSLEVEPLHRRALCHAGKQRRPPPLLAQFSYFLATAREATGLPLFRWVRRIEALSLI